MKFCQHCGAKLNDDARFCDKCGAKVNSSENNSSESPAEVDKVYRCRYCGQILPSMAVRCPACGNEIRGAEANSTVKELFNEIKNAPTDADKIELIKMFPIPNTKEDIIEVMILASSNFNAAHYGSVKGGENIDSAWYTLINNCYKKANLVFHDSGDLAMINNIYNGVQEKLDVYRKRAKTMIIIGIILTIIGGIGSIITMILAVQSASTTTTSSLESVSTSSISSSTSEGSATISDPVAVAGGLSMVLSSGFLTGGILLLVFGLRKYRTLK